MGCEKRATSHLHPYDEAIVFFSLEQSDLSHLGAEMTVEIGKEHEKYTFDKPAVLPSPGYAALPITCNKVDRPYAVMQIGLGPKYKSEWV